ncbi:dicarboxylate/amino acid:cation symporter [Nocardia terpenica]|uniref:Sodium:proton antiporter n=1 Tax=Nocardia terpenica TaxID=455432 RepID=A0A164L6N4_9NOCA|nr:dicarboxylate/amino acid:cation symporter [Nocardia terpenica]KZM72080.1 sodium:proton antiporter [Nocardia terpenica]MBF6060590.1 dicarboxylate/amino acid:cation symporter [Nocardia terpenica]MBF6103850.1 dicarboxylate/amino acid:cation symporter [Nocardia terpenica]MBF6111776.1 dicarboxylate/amino acid:cation symporter [Nocardia terpenica]MBF6118071.1 dicarboxylate/amino acid:cation symporter [Nocardia terpenica]
MSSPSSSTSASPLRLLNPVRWPFGIQILAGLVVGIAAGFIARAWHVAWLASTLSQVGGIFVQLLKLAVPPLVFTAVLVSVAGLRHVTNAARLAGRTLLWFLGTSLIAVVVGIVLGLITNPGRGVNLSLSGAKAPDTQGGWTDFLTGIIPKGAVDAFTTNGSVLQLVFLGAVLGVAAVKLGEAAKPFLTLAESVLQLVQKALWWVIRLAPVGTAGLIGKAIASYGWNLLRPLATFTVAVYAGCLIVLVVVYPVLLRLVGGVSPLRFYSRAWPALELAFVSRSSVGTMPLTQRMTTERLGVPNEYASFAVPFGATTKMDGCAAVYPALAAIFVAQITGTHLGIRDYLLIAFVSVVGSAATAGLTGAIVMLTLTLSTLGLPLAGAGLLLAIDPILDMIRTATNVAGQMVVPVLVAKREGILDETAFTRKSASLDAPETMPGEVPAAA